MLFFAACKKNSNDQNPNQLPVIGTTSIGLVSDSGLTLTVDIASAGVSNISGKGVVVGNDSMPTLEANILKTSNGSGQNSFTVTIKGLVPSTKYFLRAYATNTIGTAYGAPTGFTTHPDSSNLPVVITNTPTYVNDSATTVSGNVVNNGGFPITASGIVYGTDSVPTLGNAFNSPNTTFLNPGEFDCPLNGLSQMTRYYARAYATNSKGTSYGNQVTFQTPENPYKFHFFKDQYTDTTIVAGALLETSPETIAGYFMNSMILPDGIYLYVQITSVTGKVTLTDSYDSTTRYLNVGDTVHIDPMPHDYVLAAPGYLDNWGNPFESNGTYDVKIGGKVTTTDNQYYCYFVPEFDQTITETLWRIHSDTRQQCDFEH